MTKFYCLGVLKTSKHEIMTGPDSEETMHPVDFLEKYIENNKEYWESTPTETSWELISKDKKELLEREKDKRSTIILMAENTLRGYTSNFKEILEKTQAIHKIFILKYNIKDQSSTGTVIERDNDHYKPYETKGAKKARGYDVVEKMEEKYDVELEEHWEKLLTKATMEEL